MTKFVSELLEKGRIILVFPGEMLFTLLACIGDITFLQLNSTKRRKLRVLWSHFEWKSNFCLITQNPLASLDSILHLTYC